MSHKTHLTEDNRKTIEHMLGEGFSASAIARKLDVSKSTITREIEKRMTATTRTSCECEHYVGCALRNICDRCPYRESERKYCKYCKKAQSVCPRFAYRDCPNKSAVHVCNHCQDKKKCNRRKTFYKAQIAQESYEKTLSDSRSGFSCDEEELETLSVLLQEKLGNGQSLYVIKTNHPEIRISESTMRRMINKSKFTGVGNLDLPRTVKFKRRSGYDYKHKKEIAESKKGRSIEDFNAYMEEHPGTNYVEMDTVVRKVNATSVALKYRIVRRGNLSDITRFLRMGGQKRKARQITERYWFVIAFELNRQTLVRAQEKGPHRDPFLLQPLCTARQLLSLSLSPIDAVCGFSTDLSSRNGDGGQTCTSAVDLLQLFLC